MIKSVWSHIVVERSDPHRDVIALLNGKCCLQWPCAYSSDPTCVGHDLPFVQITSRWFGYIALETEGMMSRWLHALQQFQFSIVHRPGKDHGNAGGLSRAPSSPCRQCTEPDCPPAVLMHYNTEQPFDSVSTGSSEDADLVPVQFGEDWIARLDDDLSQPAEISGDSFRISALQREDPVCITLHAWIVADEFPPWAEVRSMLPELRSLWHHRNNLSVDDNGTLWRKRSSQSALLQLLVPKAGRERLFLFYHASLYGGHLGRTRTLARLADRFYWSGMSDDVKDWLGQCVACIKRKSPVGRHHPLGNIPTGHRWDRIAMDILYVCDPTPEGFRYILVIADYFSKWTEAFPMKNKCADTVADILVENIILRFRMPLVIHSDQGREFENHYVLYWDARRPARPPITQSPTE